MQLQKNVKKKKKKCRSKNCEWNHKWKKLNEKNVKVKNATAKNLRVKRVKQENLCEKI